MFVKTDVRNRYDDHKNQAREMASDALPDYLRRVRLDNIDHKSITASKLWSKNTERRVDWDWSFAKSYCSRFPKSFDLSIWHENTLLSLSLGRPTFHGNSMRLDYVERSTDTDLYSGRIFTINRIAFETYGRLIGAEFIRIMEPMNEKLISHYLAGDKGFTLAPAKRNVPHYLVKKL